MKPGSSSASDTTCMWSWARSATSRSPDLKTWNWRDFIWKGAAQGMSVRCGIGYDLHRLAEGRKLIVGGIELPFEKGPVGHSDGDVLSHALCDALLGAAGLGDIGTHFPDTDPKWK